MAIKVLGNIVISDTQAISNVTTINANGNITGNYFIGNGSQLTGIDATAIQNGTANVRTFENANVAISAAGNANILLVTGTGANIAGVINVTGPGVSSFAGNLDMTNNTISNLSNPSNPQDAATKFYVDTVAEGLHVHNSCYVATTDTLANASGGTTSYNNGSSGVGAYIATTGTYYLIDTANVQTVGTRILVKNEANAVWNGIYTYANTTHLVRATDFDTTAEAAGGDFLFVTSGNVNADTGWVQTTDNPVIGVNNIVFTQFSGAGVYQAGTGLTLTGSVFSVNASQTQITTVGTLGNLTVTGNTSSGNFNTTGQFTSTVSTGTAPLVVTSTTVVANLNANALQGNTPSQSATANTIVQRNADGNITANFFIGNGAQLTGLSTAGVSNGNSNVNIPAANGNVNISSAGNANVLVVTGNGVVVGSGSGGNISGVNVFAATTITATGNVTGGNLTTVGLIVAQSNVTGGNITTAGVVTATGNVTGGNLVTGGVLSVTGNANVGNLGTAGLITATGNITGGNLITSGSIVGAYANGNSNVSIPAANGNVNISSAGNANVLVVTGTGAVFGSGGNVTGANVITANTFTGVLANGNSNVRVTSANGYVAISAEGNANILTITGTSAVFGSGSGGNISGANVITANSANILVSLGVGTAPSGTTGEIRATNNITAYYSDRRLKTDISTIDGALNKLCAISGVYFRPNDVAKLWGYGDSLQVGVIAQEVEAVLPEIVTRAPFDIVKDADGKEISKSGQDYKTVWYDKLIPLVVEAIKELKIEVDNLKNKN